MSAASIAEFGARASAMIDALAAISAEPDRIVRLYLTPEHKRAAALVEGWMKDAGLAVRMDNAGTVRGSLPPGAAGRSGNRILLVGSHIDTVIDAGRYDGNLGVVAGILAIEELKARGIALPFGIDILAFGDEEGVRFPVTMTSSTVAAGVFDPKTLDAKDGEGVTLREALVGFGCDPARLSADAYERASALGYLEVHIEQGPVLEAEGEALGAVTAIASQGRNRVRLYGEAGHAGTVPMPLRKDALVAASEMIVGIEAIARRGAKDALVATVGQLEVLPGASNVIPAEVRFSLDVRAANDAARHAASAEMRRLFDEVAARRGIRMEIETVMETPVSTAAPRIVEAIGTAIASLDARPVRKLMSGAGHDGQSMAHLCDFGMIFVRCRGGISHNPKEFVANEDMGAAVEALIRTILELARQEEVR